MHKQLCCDTGNHVGSCFLSGLVLPSGRCRNAVSQAGVGHVMSWALAASSRQEEHIVVVSPLRRAACSLLRAYLRHTWVVIERLVEAPRLRKAIIAAVSTAPRGSSEKDSPCSLPDRVDDSSRDARVDGRVHGRGSISMTSHCSIVFVTSDRTLTMHRAPFILT